MKNSRNRSFLEIRHWHISTIGDKLRLSRNLCWHCRLLAWICLFSRIWNAFNCYGMYLSTKYLLFPLSKKGEYVCDILFRTNLFQFFKCTIFFRFRLVFYIFPLLSMKRSMVKSACEPVLSFSQLFNAEFLLLIFCYFYIYEIHHLFIYIKNNLNFKFQWIL